MRDYTRWGEGPGVDELVCGESVVHNQLIELVAEDLALEDTIYQLGKALSGESVNLDLEKFLKVCHLLLLQSLSLSTDVLSIQRIRGLAMKQFEKRSLINQITTAL